MFYKQNPIINCENSLKCTPNEISMFFDSIIFQLEGFSVECCINHKLPLNKVNFNLTVIFFINCDSFSLSRSLSLCLSVFLFLSMTPSLSFSLHVYISLFVTLALPLPICLPLSPSVCPSISLGDSHYDSLSPSPSFSEPSQRAHKFGEWTSL